MHVGHRMHAGVDFRDIVGFQMVSCISSRNASRRGMDAGDRGEWLEADAQRFPLTAESSGGPLRLDLVAQGGQESAEVSLNDILDAGKSAPREQCPVDTALPRAPSAC